MDSGNNNNGGFNFKFDFGKKPNAENIHTGSKGFKQAFSDFKEEMKTKDNNRKGSNPLKAVLLTLVNNVYSVLCDASSAKLYGT